MYIPGISASYHDSAACLIKDVEILFGMQKGTAYTGKGRLSFSLKWYPTDEKLGSSPGEVA